MNFHEGHILKDKEPRRLIMPEKLNFIDLQISNPNEALELFGTNDRFLKHIEEKLHVSIITRGSKIQVSANQESDKDRKSTRLNSSHVSISYAVFCLKKKKK